MNEDRNKLKSKSALLLDDVEIILFDVPGVGQPNVYRSDTWPLTDVELPAILIPGRYIEERESTGKASPEYDVITTFKVVGRASALAGVDDNGADLLQNALEILKVQIERRLIGAYPIMLAVSSIMRIESEFQVIADAQKPTGEVRMTFKVLFREGPEDFAIPDADPINEISVSTDLLNVFDPLGDYSAGTLFPQSITAPPRTIGPDGRIEGGGLYFTNLQD